MIYPGFSSLCAFSIRSTCTAYAAAALRQLQQEHGLRREISDMVHHEGMAVEPTVSEVQAALRDLSDAMRGAASLARTAGDAAAARVVGAVQVESTLPIA
jgi:hypothetical protein